MTLAGYAEYMLDARPTLLTEEQWGEERADGCGTLGAAVVGMATERGEWQQAWRMATRLTNDPRGAGTGGQHVERESTTERRISRTTGTARHDRGRHVLVPILGCVPPDPAELDSE